MIEKLAVRNSEIPVVYCNSRYVLRNPSIVELAQCLDLNINTDKSVRDVVVIVAGPAGLGAAVYAAPEGLKTGSVKRVAYAVGEGSMAVHLMHRYLAECADQSAPAQPEQVVPASITV
jgi:thioredoxin reductase (NADPH)